MPFYFGWGDRKLNIIHSRLKNMCSSLNADLHLVNLKPSPACICGHGTKIYDKRDDFNFKIINFPNMCSNIPASPAYGVYISQLIRYARASSNYSDFLKRHLHLRNRLLDQGYKKIRLIRSLKKFIFRYQYLVEIYSVSAEIIISDAFSYSENV